VAKGLFRALALAVILNLPAFVGVASAQCPGADCPPAPGNTVKEKRERAPDTRRADKAKKAKKSRKDARDSSKAGQVK
jgi:hypothetical protein